MNSRNLVEAIATTEVDLVISLAAHTAVDRAETEPDITRQINAIAAHEIAEGAAQIGAPIIHISTDYVFDGLLRAYIVKKIPLRHLASTATPSVKAKLRS